MFFKEARYLHTLYLFEIKFTNSMAAKLFWAFGGNEGTNNKRENINHSRNIEMKEIIKVKE